MQLTKEVLQNDRKVFADRIQSDQTTVAYIDGLLAFLDRPDPAPAAAEVVPAPEAPAVEPPAIEGEVI